MIEKDRLIHFKKMWTWLCAHPAHDQNYYMEHVVTLDEKWLNDCPLANGKGAACDGCSGLWQSRRGSLCTDPDSPLFKYLATDIRYPDYRSYFASLVSVLATKVIRDRGIDERSPLFGSDYINNQLHG